MTARNGSWYRLHVALHEPPPDLELVGEKVPAA